jgi:hypothetical protein
MRKNTDARCKNQEKKAEFEEEEYHVRLFEVRITDAKSIGSQSTVVTDLPSLVDPIVGLWRKIETTAGSSWRKHDDVQQSRQKINDFGLGSWILVVD